jgi:hypothetical protein
MRPHRLALALAALGVAVGSVVGLVAAASGVGSCSSIAARRPVLADPVCASLARGMAVRVGAAVGLLTILVVLTFVGLARTAAVSAGSEDPGGGLEGR